MGSGSVDVPTGSYIVGVNKTDKAALLDAMNEALGWQPTLRYSDNMPMFAGTLNKEQVLWLLQREEVNYIEEDEIVSIASPTPAPSPNANVASDCFVCRST